MKLLVGNFDFEHELASGKKRELPARILRLNAELAPVLALIAQDEDRLWVPQPIDPEFFAGLAAVGLATVWPVQDERDVPRGVELCPWGWTNTLHQWGKRQNWRVPAPPVAAVSQVNSRRFSFQIEEEWNVGLCGARAVRSLDELAAAVRELPAQMPMWVLKAEFSMSARERILGRSRELDERTCGWASRRLTTDGILFFEPWMDRIEEAGLQFTVRPTGEPVLEGITPLLTDAWGRYRGSRFSDDQAGAVWSSAIEVGLRAATRAQQAGYFGPLGIDAVRFRDAVGNECLRPLQDVNGRWTMGRLSLGLRRLIGPGEFGSWLHLRNDRGGVSTPGHSEENPKWRLPSNVRMVWTSPSTVGGEASAYRTVALFTSTRDSLLATENQLLASCSAEDR